MTGPVEKGLQQREFAGRKRYGAALAQHFMGDRVDAQRAVVDRRIGTTGLASQQRVDARGELLEVERLDHVIVGAGVEAGDTIRHGVACGQDQYRHAIALLA